MRVCNHCGSPDLTSGLRCTKCGKAPYDFSSQPARKEPPMSEIEAMAIALFQNDDRYKNCVWQGLPDRLQAMFRSDATAALAALRETHHLVPRTDGPECGGGAVTESGGPVR
jgi:hypothetical protein